jgi:hypothetical protein
MMIFTISPFLGPAAGPIVGGFINQFADWYVTQPTGQCRTDRADRLLSQALDVLYPPHLDRRAPRPRHLLRPRDLP